MTWDEVSKPESMNAKGYSAREEQRLLDALGCGLLKEFPNPERSGCPGADILKRIAARTMPLNEAEKWPDHLGLAVRAIATSLNSEKSMNSARSASSSQWQRAFCLLQVSPVGSVAEA
jgi:hypothetical protein